MKKHQKVDGNFVSAASHPQIFAANPSLRPLAAKEPGGRLLLSDATLQELEGGRALGQGYSSAPLGEAATLAWVDTHLASRRAPAKAAAPASAPVTAESLRRYGYSPAQAERMLGGPPDTKVTPEAVDAFFAMRREARASARR